MSEGTLSAEDAANAEGSTLPAARWPHYVLAGVLVAAALIQLFVWVLWDSPMGDSVPNLVTYALGGLVAFVVLVWLVRYAPLPRRSRRVAALLLLAPAIGYAATIREVEWTGDMRIVVRHRWEETDAERLAAHRARQGKSDDPVQTAPAVARPEDMPTYRGAASSGIVVGPELSQDWDAAPPKLLWRQPCGGGYAQFAVVEPYAVTIEQRGPNEAVVCYDTATGHERWVHEYAAEFTEAMGGPGPRATPTIAEGEVYSVGAKGEVRKLSLSTGELQWRRDILDDYKAPNTEWAMSSAPLIVAETVVVNPGGPKGDGLVALDRATGSPVWERDGAREHSQASEDNNRSGYSTPFLADVLGVRQIVMFDGAGLRGYEPDTGELLWEYRHRNGAGVNVAQPLVFDDGRIFISCSYDKGCAMVQVLRDGEEWSAKPLWTNLNLRCKFSSPILHEGYIYGLDEGILVCLDPATGERKWKKGRYGHGQMLLTNDQLLVHSEDGWAVLIDPDPSGLRELTRLRTLEDPKNWNPPALVDGRLYLRNHREMAAFDLRADRQ